MNLQSFVRFYRDIITLCIALFLSSILLFSNDSIIVDKLQSDIADIYSIITYPQRWYRDILSIKEQNNIMGNVKFLMSNLKRRTLKMKGRKENLMRKKF